MAHISHLLEISEHDYSFYEVEFEGEKFTQFILENGVVTADPGAPEIPDLLITLAVPGLINKVEEVNLDFNIGEKKELQLEHQILPVQKESLPSEEDMYDVEYMNRESIPFYKPEAFQAPIEEFYSCSYPVNGLTAEILNVKPGNVFSLVDISVKPIVYLPAENIIKIADNIRLAIQTESEETELIQRLREIADGEVPEEYTELNAEEEKDYPVNGDIDFEELDFNLLRFLTDELSSMTGRVANPELINDTVRVFRKASQTQLMYSKTSRKYVPYVIITDNKYWMPDHPTSKKVKDPDKSNSSTMTEEFQRLADWKSQKGLPAKVITVEQITQLFKYIHNTAIPVRDVPEAIREFIKYIRRKWGTRYVLLGGDIEIVPGRMVVWPAPAGYNLVSPVKTVKKSFYEVDEFNLNFDSNIPGNITDDNIADINKWNVVGDTVLETYTPNSTQVAPLFKVKMTLHKHQPAYDSKYKTHKLIPEIMPVFFSEKTHRKFEYKADAGKFTSAGMVEGWCYAKDKSFTDKWKDHPTKYIMLYTTKREETENYFFFADPLNRWHTPVTDSYYSSLFGKEYNNSMILGCHDWDQSNTGYYGLSQVKYARPESPNVGGVHWDTYDVHVGRAPVIDVQEARDFINRSLIADKLTTLNEKPLDVGFTKKLLLFSGYQLHENRRGVDYYAMRTGFAHREFAKGNAKLDYKHVERYYSDAVEYWNNSYWGQGDRTRWPGSMPPKVHDNTDPQTKKDVINSWNDGYGYITVAAHGGKQGTSKNFINKKVLLGLKNGPNYGVAYVYSCSTAFFDDYRKQIETNQKQYLAYKLKGDYWPEACIAEKAIYKPDAGVAAYVGMSRGCWMTRTLTEKFWRKGLQILKAGHNPTLGDMFSSTGDHYMAYPNNSNRSARMLMQLFGDPELNVSFGYTEEMNVWIYQDSPQPGTLKVQVEDCKGNILTHAKVSLWQKRKEPLVALTDKKGEAIFSKSSFKKGSSLKLTIVGNLHRPYHSIISVL